MFKKILNSMSQKLYSCADIVLTIIEDKSNLQKYVARDSWDPEISKEDSLKFHDLIKMHLEDHGYKVLILEFKSTTLPPTRHMIVFNSRIKHWLKLRHNAIVFEVGRHKYGTQCNYNLVWMFKLEMRQHASHWNPDVLETRYAARDDRILCDLTNPKCLDIILDEVKRHYGTY
jgi:hypothetical protein